MIQIKEKGLYSDNVKYFTQLSDHNSPVVSLLIFKLIILK